MNCDYLTLMINKTTGALDTLIAEIEEGMDDEKSKFYQCKPNFDYIKIDNNLTTDPDFVSGVNKIQKGIMYELSMTREEKNACRCLLKSENENDDDGDEADSPSKTFKQRVAEQQKRKAKEISGESSYINCDFLMSSAAIVESFWSETDGLLANK